MAMNMVGYILAPTISTKALFLTCIIDAKEECQVATANIPGFFFQTPADDKEYLVICLDCHMARALINIDPEKYKPEIVHEKGKPVIYGKANKAICSTLNIAILEWKNLSTYLQQEMGFKINQYDCCVTNKIINHQ